MYPNKALPTPSTSPPLSAPLSAVSADFLDDSADADEFGEPAAVVVANSGCQRPAYVGA